MARRFQIVITGTIPEGMTLAQARHAYWNGGFNGNGARYDTVSVDVVDYFADYRPNRPEMKLRLGRASLIRKAQP